MIGSVVVTSELVFNHTDIVSCSLNTNAGLSVKFISSPSFENYTDSDAASYVES